MAVFSALFGRDNQGDDSVKSRSRSRAPQPPQAPGPTNPRSRTRPPDAPILGTAVPRPKPGETSAPEPPDAVQLGANNADAARAAALRARRKGAGSSVLTGLGPGGAATPGARLNPRALLGY